MLIVSVDFKKYKPLFLAPQVSGASRIRAEISPKLVILGNNLICIFFPLLLLELVLYAMLHQLKPKSLDVASTAEPKNTNDLGCDVVSLFF